MTTVDFNFLSTAQEHRTKTSLGVKGTAKIAEMQLSGWCMLNYISVTLCWYFPGELIPPKSSLTFEVELLDIKDGNAPPNVFKEIDSNEDKFLSQEEVIIQWLSFKLNLGWYYLFIFQTKHRIILPVYLFSFLAVLLSLAVFQGQYH